ncbi:MAG: hypothetical protein LN412_01050, partial [Candidatus Thermoplasmatota archaeon]|nr:hypothetical protein [Candidatus Thermoplasmatota archaeon]
EFRRRHKILEPHVNTFLWVWMYSLYTNFKIARLELTLKPFTEDRSLGFNPLGRFSLELTGLDMLPLALVLAPNVLGGLLSLPILRLFMALSLLGLVFFFLPLLPLRQKLLQAKGELLSWIGPRYTPVFERIDSGTEGRISQAFANELMAIEKIQRDVQRIHTWPFDTGVVVRISVIVFSVTAIVSARIIASLLGF